MLGDPPSSESLDELIDRIANEFEQTWRAGDLARIEELVSEVEAGVRPKLLQELLLVDLELRAQLGEPAASKIYLGRFADDARLRDVVRRFLNHPSQQRADSLDRDSHPPRATGQPAFERDGPVHIGRYQIQRLLGEGGFGRVYLAHDPELDRRVAIKVPRRNLVSEADQVEAYLREARTVARLDHPHIVPVHDIGRADDFPCYIVSKYVEGEDLASRIGHGRLELNAAVELVATVGEALHCAHQHGLVHRDVKPGNVLIGDDCHVYLADFGLALREDNFGQGPRYAGTSNYMSPEQARGEGHRVDRRSDIYSLGAVMYELLVGRRTFRGDSPRLLEQIANNEPTPPRQIDDSIPAELERICLKSLSSRASERYATALDMARDLRDYSAHEHVHTAGATRALVAGGTTEPGVEHTAAAGIAADSEHPSLRIVPKGLRSFDQQDADFFLALLPGPRDRQGLPEVVRFWKTRIEAIDQDDPFTVGLLYGPSGCGKSSLIKAGLLPRLKPEVVAVYLEATPNGLEAQLLHALRRRFPEFGANLSLQQTLARLRCGQGIPRGGKVLIVLDQFEQWLHAGERENSDLVQALRQCDGNRVQCILMVRDDFWMAVTRFLRALEVRLLEGHNLAAVDLFPAHHARQVLAAFGRAFRALPADDRQISVQQQQFLQQSVAELAEDGRVICVRLALFAEMMNGRSWQPETLVEVGGTTGVGVTFLERTFSAPSAPPRYRHRQQAARAVLKALLPQSGSDIKGHMRSYAELSEASGCAHRPADFQELIGILDAELRLITPCDAVPETEQERISARHPVNADRRPGMTAEEGGVTRLAASETAHATHHELASTVPQSGDARTAVSPSPSDSRASQETPENGTTSAPLPSRYYQLTHDYLVHSLRDWLRRGQQASRRGRAELRLAERVDLWRKKPETRYLPSFWEHANIRLLTDRRAWNHNERKMMSRAALVHATRATTVLLGLAVVSWGSFALAGWFRVSAQLSALLTANVEQVQSIAEDLASYRSWAVPHLRRLLASGAETPAEQRRMLHARLALVRHDPSQIDHLCRALLAEEDPSYLAVIRESLWRYRQQTAGVCWHVLHDDAAEPATRFRASLALAGYEPSSDLWTAEDERFVAEQLVATNPIYQPTLWQLLDPIRDRLVEPLAAVSADSGRPETQQISAANGLVSFAADDVPLLADLLVEVTPAQYEILYAAVAKRADARLRNQLRALVQQQPSSDLNDAQRVALGRRRAGAAITLLRLGNPRAVLDVMQFGEDIESLTQFVHGCRARNAAVPQLLTAFNLAVEQWRAAKPAEKRSAAFVLYGLLLSLGEFPWEEVPAAHRGSMTARLVDWYATHPSSSVHGATGWVLKQWGFHREVARVDRTPLPFDETGEREWFVLEIRPGFDLRGNSLQHVRPIHFTFIVLEPGEFWMGSPNHERGRSGLETLKKRKLTRCFAISDREVTWEQFNPSDGGNTYNASNAVWSWELTPQDPVNRVTWFDAVRYCRWLTSQAGLAEVQQCYAADAISGDVMSVGKDVGDTTNWPVRLDRHGFRLLTEAEWEYACRSNTRTAFSFGSDISLLGDYGWSKNNCSWAQPVGLLRPNPRGIFDLHGNLYEWCNDWRCHDVPPGPAIDSAGPTDGVKKIRRGGSTYDFPRATRSAARGLSLPSAILNTAGIRIALTAAPWLAKEK